MAVGETDSTRRAMAPSLSRMVSPAFTSSTSPGKVMEAWLASPWHSSVTSVKRLPASSWAPPPWNSPRRISGPLVSNRLATGTFSSSRRRERVWKASRWLSWVPWEKLNRATSIPARIMLRMTPSETEAGPSVQTIFVFLIGIVSPQNPRPGQIRPDLTTA